MTPQISPIGKNAIRLLKLHQELVDRWGGRVTWNMVLAHVFRKLDTSDQIMCELNDEISFLDIENNDLREQLGMEKRERREFAEKALMKALEQPQISHQPMMAPVPQMNITQNTAVAPRLPPPPPSKSAKPMIKEMHAQFQKIDGPIKPSLMATAEFNEPKFLPVEDYEAIQS